MHGVVDVYGAKKQSYELLRRESSPIEALSVENHLNTIQVILRTRGDVPMYTLRGYKLLSTFYGQGDIPLELREVGISELPPASSARLPSSQATLRSPGPLRTVLDTFASHGSSIQ